MLTVRDIMQTDVVTVLPNASVQDLTRVLADSGISGVPVVDTTGKVMGVVSATDVLRTAAEQADVHVTELSFPAHWSTLPDNVDREEDLDAGWAANGGPVLALSDASDWLADAAISDLTVADIMTDAHYSIDPDAPVAELAHFLHQGRIHRALVVEDGHLVAIVTTFDVLEAVASALV